jgi:hypothetical protein
MPRANTQANDGAKEVPGSREARWARTIGPGSGAPGHQAMQIISYMVTVRFNEMTESGRVAAFAHFRSFRTSAHESFGHMAGVILLVWYAQLMTIVQDEMRQRSLTRNSV